MKQLIKLGLLSHVLCCTPLFALNPINGFYGGLLGELSHGPSNDDIVFREDGQVFHGKVDYSSISGGAGFMLGYRYNHGRLEGEFLYNHTSTGPVTVGTCTIESVNVTTPTGLCPAGAYDDFKAKALGYSGSSTAMFGLFNLIWDFYSEEHQSEVAPYLGVGFGMASIKNGSSFVTTTTGYSHGNIQSGSGSAYQGILGVSYYMDDFTWCSVDYRYLSATRKADTSTELGTHIPSTHYPINAFNLTVNVAFDKGGF